MDESIFINNSDVGSRIVNSNIQKYFERNNKNGDIDIGRDQYEAYNDAGGLPPARSAFSHKFSQITTNPNFDNKKLSEQQLPTIT